MLYRITFLFFLLVPLLPANSQDDRRVITGKINVTTSNAEILGKDLASSYQKILEPNEDIKWTMHVPDNYDPSYPPGIIVHLSERNNAVLPFGWNSVLRDKNLIWISLNKAGRLPQNKEMLLTVLSTAYVESKYRVNSDRVYISSITEGCMSASAAMQVYPSVFKGAIYTSCMPINWKSDIPPTIEEMKKNRYVFVSGSNNALEREMRRIVKRYKSSGLEKVEHKNLPLLAYGKNLNRRRLNDYIEFLDIRDEFY